MNTPTPAENLRIRWLRADSIRAGWNPDQARLTVTLDSGEVVPDARALRAFPVSHPAGYIQIANAKGEAVGMLQTLDGLPVENRTALRAALDARYLIPQVRRILELREISPFVLRWSVETDRGPCTFTTESTREALRHMGPDRVRVTDLSGNHFDFPGISTMDPVSRGLLGNFM